MRLPSLLLLLVALPVAALASRVELPEWSDAGESNAYELGGGLWPVGLLPESAGLDEDGGEGEEGRLASAEGVPDGDASDAETLPDARRFYGPGGAVAGTAGADAWEWFGPPAPDATPAPALADAIVEPVEPAALEPLPPLEGELADLYFEHAPVDYLIDPQRLLTEQKSNDIKRFLEFHSDEAEFKIYVMVVGENQAVPEGIDLVERHRDWFSETPTVLMLYYREHPAMTELFINESIRSSMPDSVFDRILQNCLREGGATDDAPDQVEKMAIELSIQLYWLGRLMEAERGSPGSLAAAAAEQELPASASAPELLREYAPGIFLEEPGKALSVVSVVATVLGVFTLVGLVGWGGAWWRRRRETSGQPLIFPNFEIVPRLGGEFSGGSFIGMSFDLGDGPSRRG